jgi:hypothetical protein
MTDVERELRKLGERARDEKASKPSLGTSALRRIRLRRFGMATSGLVLVAVLGVGGTFAAGAFETDERNIGPAQPSPVSSPSADDGDVDDPYRCRRPTFKPSYLPDGWSEELRPHRGSGLEAPGVVGHWGTSGPPTRERYVDLLMGKSPYQQFSRTSMRVLGGDAIFGAVSQGYTVEFSHAGCDYVLHSYRLGNWEFRRFAERLESSRTDDPDEEVASEDFSALWPEDTYEDAEEACEQAERENEDSEAGVEDVVSFRNDPQSVALEFGYQVLGWQEPSIADGPYPAEPKTNYELRREDASSGEIPAAVVIHSVEVLPGCWSVESVSRMPKDQPKDDGSMSVTGRDVQMGFDKEGAISAVFEVGYGGEKTTHVWRKGDPELVAFVLDFEPRGEGHFLVLLRDADGQVFSAFGSALPEGDFAAG